MDLVSAFLAIGLTVGPADPASSALETEAADPPADTVEYRIDPRHAEIGFQVRHLGLSRVRGRFGTMSGRLHFVPEDPTSSTVSLTIDATSVDTDNERRDDDLRENFLEVAEYPEITFESTAIEALDDRRYRVRGDFTLHGVTRQIDFPLELYGPVENGGLEFVAVSGDLQIDRRDYGITLSRVLETGAIVVGNEVDITIDMEWGRRLPTDGG